MRLKRHYQESEKNPQQELNSKKTNDQVQRQAKDLPALQRRHANDQYTREQMLKCTPKPFHTHRKGCVPNQNVREEGEKRGPSHLAGGDVNGVGRCGQLCTKLTTHDPFYSWIYIQRGRKQNAHEYLYVHDHRRVIHNSRRAETTKCLRMDEWLCKLWCIQYSSATGRNDSCHSEGGP